MLRVWWDFFLPSHLPLGPAAPVPPPLDIAEVEIGLLYPPVGGDLLWFVALHVLLHGGEAGAVLQADGALVGGSAIVGPKVFDHGRVVPGALVAQLALKWLLACVDPVVGLQLVLEAELLATAVALIGLLTGVDALVALQCALVPEAAAAELALVGVVACVGAQVPLERGVAGEGAVALAADVAAHPSVHLHVLLQGALRLEPLAAQQAENSHVCTSVCLPVRLQGIFLRELSTTLITDQGFGTR